MDIFVNDLSIRGQFHDTFSFQAAMARLMKMRQIAQGFEREIHCHSALLTSEPIPCIPMKQVLGRLPNDSQRRSIMAWLTKGGPFWDDVRQHGASDWLECRSGNAYQGEIVTDSAVGEAAYRILHCVDAGVVSVTPSEWEFSPIEVAWVLGEDNCESRMAKVGNWINAAELKDRLQALAPPIRTWKRLKDIAFRQFNCLKFADDCFDPLYGIPFSPSSANRIRMLLGILDRLARSFDELGERTAEGHRLHQEFFQGDRALFSDSSEKEKNQFRNKLTFTHPEDPAAKLFCTWHGKEHHSTLRLHYWWSGVADDSVYVVYVGPKITKQ